MTDQINTAKAACVLAYRLCSHMGDDEAVTSTLHFALHGYDPDTYTVIVTNALAIIATRVLPIITAQAGDMDEFRSRCARLATHAAEEWT